MARITISIHQQEDHVIVSLFTIEKPADNVSRWRVVANHNNLKCCGGQKHFNDFDATYDFDSNGGSFQEVRIENDDDYTFPSFCARPTPRCLLSFQTIWVKCPAGKANKAMAFSSSKFLFHF